MYECYIRSLEKGVHFSVYLIRENNISQNAVLAVPWEYNKQAVYETRDVEQAYTQVIQLQYSTVEGFKLLFKVLEHKVNLTTVLLMWFQFYALDKAILLSRLQGKLHRGTSWKSLCS